MRRKVLKIYGWTFLIGTVYASWVLLTGKFIECFYWKATGYLCPGCGLTRMFISLIKLDVAAAFNYNPVMFIVL